jgi:hypothetical protein
MNLLFNEFIELLARRKFTKKKRVCLASGYLNQDIYSLRSFCLTKVIFEIFLLNFHRFIKIVYKLYSFSATTEVTVASEMNGMDDAPCSLNLISVSNFHLYA